MRQMRSPFALALALALSAAACIVEQDLGSHGARDGAGVSSGTGVSSRDRRRRRARRRRRSQRCVLGCQRRVFEQR